MIELFDRPDVHFNIFFGFNTSNEVVDFTSAPLN